MRAAGTPPLHIAGRGQDGGLQLHRGVVQSRPPPFWHPPPIPDCLRDADTQGNPNDLSDKPSTKPGQLHSRYFRQPCVRALVPSATPRPTRKQAGAFDPRTGLRDALRERALVGLPEREATAFRSGVNRPPLDPSYHRLRRRRLSGPQSSPRSPRGPAPKRAQRYPCRPRSEAIKPNPFMALYHLTVPDSSTAARSAGG